jgi:parallel beta helix pectate lyase-like protein
MFSVACRRAVLCLLGAAVFSLVLSPNLSASSAVVTPPSTTPCKALPSYPTISLAVSSVPAGSLIYICPGTYAEQVVITKKLTLEGVAGNGSAGAAASGSNNPVIVSPAGGVVVNSNDLYPGSQPTAAQIFVQTPSNALATPIVVNISNITVDGSNNLLGDCSIDLVGIYYQNANGTVNHVTTRYQELAPDLFGCQDGLAIYAQSGYGTGGTATVTIEGSSVHDYDKNGITADGSGTVATITGNYIVGIGATPLIGQNGIQMSFGARGKIQNNTVTDDVYVNPSDCVPGTNCYSATGILLYDSGGTSADHVSISGNTVSNTQEAIVTVTDGAETADFNDVTSNKVTTNAAIVVTAGSLLLDGIDLCSDHNTATSNTVFNSSGSGVHLDSLCTEPDSSASGASSSATNNTVNEACAGVLLGNSGGTASGTVTYNVVETTASGDTCPVGNGGPSAKTLGKVRTQPKHR